MLHGAYGVMVSTRACGALSQGSNPCRHPMEGLRQNPESHEQMLEHYVLLGKNQALTLIKNRFENLNDNRLNYLDFHNSHHTEDVIRRVVLILNSIREVLPSAVSDRDMQIAILAASFHDVVQKWQEKVVVEDEKSKVMRQRLVGENEHLSIDEALVFMNKVNQESGLKIFTEEDISKLTEAILATIPEFSSEHKTVIQPNLNKLSRIITFALAFSDLGTAGIDGPIAFSKEGDALFREENLDILNTLDSFDALTDMQQQYFFRRMITWNENQITFAEGRFNYFMQELDLLPDSLRSKMENLFDKFNLSIKNAKDNLSRRSAMSCRELMLDMGYRLK